MNMNVSPSVHLTSAPSAHFDQCQPKPSFRHSYTEQDNVVNNDSVRHHFPTVHTLSGYFYQSGEDNAIDLLSACRFIASGFGT